eukprot:460437-Hanusia_phi.AAC.3
MRSLSIRALSFATRSCITPSCTSSRDPAQHTCPWFKKMLSTHPSTQASRSASCSTIIALLPPSSIVSLIPRPATCFLICLPTAVDPVKATWWGRIEEEPEEEGEANLADRRMGHEVTCHLVVAGNHVDNTRR